MNPKTKLLWHASDGDNSFYKEEIYKRYFSETDAEQGNYFIFYIKLINLRTPNYAYYLPVCFIENMEYKFLNGGSIR